MHEPIAIVGISCRLPGGNDPHRFWRLLREGREAVGPAPEGRWSDVAPELRRGGFLDRIDGIDLRFFGVSPREAAVMDPQQRLVLELGWEALEDARVLPGNLRGSRTGVYVGAIWDDYAALLRSHGAATVTQHTLAGTQRGIIANRLSYTLGLHGPSLTVDTGQSSSLVAVQLACESLRRGTAERAIAGGVNLNVLGAGTLGAEKFGALSPDGRCHTFDERANGYVRGEGGALVVLRPLADALADGDRIYCTILGGAVNNDGATDALTVPGRRGQEEVLRSAYRDAGVSPADVQYVELHGTGTRVGDPIEAAALGAVLGAGRGDGERLLVGSAKTNVGHLEGAAGVTGLVKAALSLRHGEIPASLNFVRPNPEIPLDDLRLTVQTGLTPWPEARGAVLAGVSSFGMGGTNCHLVLGGAPAAERAAAPRPVPATVPWLISGRSPKAVRAQAAKLLDFLAERPASAADVAASLATTRTAFEHRAAVVGNDRAELETALRDLAESGTGAVSGRTTDGGLAVLFTGQGAQRIGMGRELAGAFPAFAAALDAACAELDRHLPRPLREVMWADADSDDAALLDQTRYAQAALFAVEVALYRLAESFGVRPGHVAGHSIGEFAAAHAAGVLSLADAAALVAARGAFMQDLPAGGAMVSVRASADEVRDVLTGAVGLAAVNGPRSVVLSGPEDETLAVAAALEAAGRRTRRLKVSHAFHSALMEPMLDRFRAVAAGVEFRTPRMPVVSMLTGRVADDDLRDPEYWVRQIREAVRFADCVTVLRDAGVRTFLELGPGKVLTALAEENLDAEDTLFLPSLLDGVEERTFVTALAGLHGQGVAVDWRALLGDGTADLPTYAFQRRRAWPEPAGAADAASAPAPAAPEPEAEEDEGDDGPFSRRGLAALGAAEAHRRFVDLVRVGINATLGYGADDTLDLRDTFKELGFDSLSGLELRNRLQAMSGLRLPTTMIFDWPTPLGLVERLRSDLLEEPGEVPPAPLAPAVTDEPVAIVGIGCRFPGGVRSADDLWRLVGDGRDAITEFPGNRGWDLRALLDGDPDRPGGSSTRYGGFLHDADTFDAAFFGLSPREATAMDPQQRLVLETSWETFEHAGIDPSELARRPVGVFVGATAHGYGPELRESVEGYDGFRLTGSTVSVASGRVAYSFGFEGPAVTIDTACSSSLVALHLAARSLRSGECEMALAGGVTVMSSPGMFLEFSRQRGLAPDGRCKPFAASADGTGWGEGVGLVLLERLSDAERNGHTVLAVLRGSAINQDGASNGLSAPNGPSQERVIHQALANAGLTADEIDAVEAHGTGTTLGDPIEAQALLNTYGRHHTDDQPLYLGSVKSNIGHTQAAAGVAGVIKMVQAMRHGVLPRTLHLDEPSPHVDWTTGHLSLLADATPWPETGRPRRAAVSSFGISGTNAHVVLEAPPMAAPDAEPDGPVAPTVALPLSAKTPAALRAAAGRLAEHLAAHPGTVPSELAGALAGRAILGRRAVVVAGRDDHAEAVAALTALAEDRPHPSLVLGPETLPSGGGTVFVFPGQGSQWAGMGVQLIAESPVFAAAIEECAQALRPYTGWDLHDVLAAPDVPTAIDVIQPTLFALMVALARLWEHHGVHPGAVIGHSQGEIAAAHIAGALTLDDAARIVTKRAQALTTLTDSGRMVSVPLSPADAEALITRLGLTGDLHVAALNAPTRTVVAGTTPAAEALIAHCETESIDARMIPVDYASHTPHMHALRAQLLNDLGAVAPQQAAIPFYSTLTGGLVEDTTTLDATYWYDNLANPVQFHPTLTELAARHSTFIETSPHPVLVPAIRETVEPPVSAHPTLRRDDGGHRRFLTSLAAHHTHAAAPVRPAAPARPSTSLPTYPFEAERYWLAPAPATANAAGLGLGPADHPLLATTTALPDGRWQATGLLAPDAPPWLADHAVHGTPLLPGTAFLDLALHAGQAVGCPTVDELTLQAPLTEDGVRDLHVAVTAPDEQGLRRITVHSRPHDGDEGWTEHAAGVLAPAAAEPVAAVMSWPPQGAAPTDLGGLYPALAERGYDYGPAFQNLRELRVAGNVLHARVQVGPGTPVAGHGLHPALLDAALHALLQATVLREDGPVSLPFSWSGVRLHATGADMLHVTLTPLRPGTVSLHAADPAGAPVLTVAELALRPLTADLAARPTSPAANDLFRTVWRPIETAVTDRPDPVLIGDVPGGYASLAELSAAVASGAAQAPADVVALPSVLAAICGRDLDDCDCPDAVAGATADALALLQEWLDAPHLHGGTLTVCTGRAHALPGDDHPIHLPHSAVWGLVRTAQNEHPGQFHLLDTATEDVTAIAGAVAAAHALGESQLAVREAGTFRPRLVRAGTDRLLPDAPSGWRLDISGRTGTFDDLMVVPSEARDAALLPHQVRIAVRAAGVNFRDVFVTLAMREGETGLGLEGAGVVLEVGADVTDFAPGDRVLGLFEHAFASVAVADVRHLAPLPADWTFEQGASVPIVFLTAYYGLVDLADVRPGETVLVHAAAGGVGTAAVQLARHLGAEVYGTASAGKRAALHDLGLDDAHIGDSRALTFEAEFLDRTDGRGVDVVVNSLAREFVDASLRLLPRGGRFVEIGKTDIRDPATVAADHPGVGYDAFDLLTVPPDRIRGMLDALGGLFASGALRPPPVRSWDLLDARSALRHLQEGANVGKVVLLPPRPLDPDGTVLITGGTGTLGGVVARHLVTVHGARRLLLTSRRGPGSPGADELAAELEGLGAHVTVAACDASDPDALDALLSAVPADHPLTAVVHAAGILRDAPVTGLTADRVAEVLRPKVHSAWHLHQQTRDLDLAAFVLFSSAVGVLGNPGQANYAAANTYLDALAHERRAHGLAAVSVSWGLWERSSGMTGELTAADLARLRRAGLTPLADERALALLDAALQLGPPHLVATPLPARTAAEHPSPLLRDLTSASLRAAASGGAASSASWPDLIAALPADERRARVRADVRAQVGVVLGHAAPDALDAGRAFKELGFDSLTAVELRNRLNTLTGRRLPTTLVFDRPTIDSLTGYLLDELFAGESAEARVVAAPAADASDPVVVVAMSCRYPGGANTPDALWRLALEEVDAIGAFPADRGWSGDLFDPDPDRPGTSYSRHGGFLYDAGEFDAEFFGISPREALAMDPQQRVLLETSWEAMESAGLDPASLRGRPVGVFVGAISQDYGPRMHQGTRDVGGYLLTGTTTSAISGRVAYSFGFEGPAVTIDTACSSSLVALHLAARSLRSGECEMALAGGVTVMSSPGMFLEFSRQRGLAPDGRCKPFAAAADGTSFAEGAGLVILERLSDARRNGHTVLAVLRGSAINQDGASNGLSAPNGPSQERVIHQALANAGLTADQIDAVEAHGTGTTLGDPIEAQALLNTYGRHHTNDQPLHLGSIKSNIGHSQAAAGIAGVIKMVQAMRHGTLPKTLHLDEPSPHVDWTTGHLSLLADTTPWPDTDRPRRAAVSSFGISGTNAHVILEAPPEAEPAAEGTGPPVVALPLSARTPEALRAAGARLGAHLAAHPDATPGALAGTLAARTSFDRRAVVVAERDDREVLSEALAALTVGEEHPALVTGRVRDGGLAYLLSGQGSQMPGMGHGLYDTSAVFAEAFDTVCAAFDPHLDQPLKDVIFSDSDLINDTAYAQPALFALQVALHQLLRHHGVTPDVLIGHSLGELTAAHLAGLWTLTDATALVAARARLMGALPAGGGMLTVQAPESALPPLPDDVAVAAVNSPTATVLSGDLDALERVAGQLTEQGVTTRRLTVSHAFHSPLMEPILAEFGEVAAGLTYHPTTVPIVSNLTGRTATDEELHDPAYWTDHIRNTVRFHDGLTHLHTTHDPALYLELGPRPTLTTLTHQTLADAADVEPVLDHRLADDVAFLTALAHLHTRGRAVLPPSGPAPDTPPPTYPFQRRRFWLAASAGAIEDVAELGLGPADHPLLATATPLPDGRWQATARLSLETQPWLADHAVHGTPLLPGTAFLDLALHAGRVTGCPTVEELTLQTPLFLASGRPRDVHLTVTPPDEAGRRALTVHGRAGDDATWTEHATGVLAPARVFPAPPATEPPAGAEAVDLVDVYERLAEHGYDYGPAFQNLRDLRRDGSVLYGTVRLGPDLATSGYGPHPALLDAALHPLAIQGLADGETPLPFSWRDVQAVPSDAAELRVRITVTEPGTVAVVAVDSFGEPVVSVRALAMRPVSADEFRRAFTDRDAPSLFTVRWSPVPPGGAPHAPDRVLEVASDGGPRAVTGRVLDGVRAWLREDRPADARLLVVTRAAIASETLDLAQAPVWGLVRTAQAEHPDRIVLLDADGDVTADDAAAALATGLPHLALRDGRLLCPELARHPSEPGRLTGDGTVLVTGGTGTLGALVAEHLATRHDARHLLLVSRRGPDAPCADDLKARLEELGAQVTIAACDTADPDALADLLAAIPEEHPLRVVVHAAGVLRDAPLESQTDEHLAAVFPPKVDAAWNLHRQTRDLDAFILFSSAAGVLGNAGQANYAAANTYLDALAHHRHSQNLPATSIAWGLWEHSSGMTTDLTPADLARLRRSGITPLTDAQGLALLDAALGSAEPHLVAAPIVPRAPRTAAKPAPRATGLGQRLAGRPEAEQTHVLTDLVRTHVAAVLGLESGAAPDLDVPFKDLGFDSLAAVELRNLLSKATDLRLTTTLVFDHPTPGALAAHLRSELTGAGRAAAAVAPARGAAPDEPIAIVGMGCRYPGGVRSPRDLWRLVAGGVDAVGPFPADRGWDDDLFDPDPDRTGKSYARHGGFLYDAGDFDAGFFGISPREALAMDPQHRLLLETSWEAMENAGLDPAGLRGRPVGVFTGVMYDDYGSRVARSSGSLEGYLVSGSAGSIASGRVAYTFGFEGPAVTIDTACSSSLVAAHLAAQALRSGECEMALAGGVTVMATPSVFLEFSRQRGLAPDGRCKPFAASADGTGWGEGVGVLLLERLSDAERHGHPVLAVLRGSAVNQDGASNGLSAPNGPSQERVIHQALANARLTPDEIDAVEAHGTGTTLGDPIEAQALLNTYGRHHTAELPVHLGAVKSNIGHTQAAAGVAGVIKMVQAMRHGTLPKTLHLDEPSPHVDWTTGHLSLLAEAAPWPETGRPRRAAVSSFGISGTNAHVILEQAPDLEPAAPDTPETVIVPLSAKEPAALRDAAARLGAHVAEHPDLTPGDLAGSLSARSRLAHRAAVIVGCDDRDVLTGALAALAADEPHPALVTGLPERDGGLVYLLSGQGSQTPGMGRGLYDTSPVFAEAFDTVCAAFDPHLDQPLKDVIFSDSDLINDTAYAQPALFTLQVALHHLLRHHGVTPDHLLGHSLGELTAAHLAGLWSLTDATALVAARARLMSALPPGGGMLTVHASEADLPPLPDDLAIAAVNGPRSTVLSGPVDALDRFTASLDERAVKHRRLTVSHAFHSPLMEPMLAEFRKVAESLTYHPTTVPIVSNVTGETATAEQLGDAAYWTDQIRSAVRFHDGLTHLHTAHHPALYLELGPRPTLTALARSLGDAVVQPTLDPRGPEDVVFLTALAHTAAAPAAPARRIDPPPTYAFQHRRYWLAGESSPETAAGLGLDGSDHPLLGAAVELPDDAVAFTARLAPGAHPWLLDHAVHGTPLLPAAALLDLALHAGRLVGSPALDDLTLHAALILAPDDPRDLQLVVGAPDEGGARPVTVRSRPHGPDGEWTLHATGALGAGDPGPVAVPPVPADAETVDVTDAYPTLAERGYDYGPAFQNLDELRTAGAALHARVSLGEDADPAGYGVHPALLDAALHPLALGDAAGEGRLVLPYAWSDVRLHASDATDLRVAIEPAGDDAFTLTASAPDGTPVLTVGSLTVRALPADALARRRRDPLYALTWSAAPPDAEPLAADPVVLTAEDLPDTVDAVRPTAERMLAELNERLAADDAPLAVVTTRAVATGPGEAPNLAHAALWGLVRTAQSEHAGRITLVDTDGSPASAAALATAVASGHPQLALREGRALVPLLAALPAAADAPARTGTTLITGGTGALGALVAEHLATRHEARHLLLVSRRGPDAPGATDLKTRLEALGAQVTIAACDTADPDALADLLAAIPEEHPLKTVIHAAGALKDAPLISQTPDHLATVFRPKVDAAWNLHQQTHDLDAFILFSSAAGTLGTPGQANYAAANTYLDALAHLRHSQNLPATSIAWGLWEHASGMTAGLTAADLNRLRRSGIAPLTDAQGLELFDAALATDHPAPVPIALNAPALRAAAVEGTVPAVLRDLFPARSARRGAAPAATWPGRLSGRTPEEQAGLLVSLIGGQVAEVLAHDTAAAIAPDRGLFDMGLDSLTALDLQNRLSRATGLRLPSTLVFDYPTLRELGDFLRERLTTGTSDGAADHLAALTDLESAFATLPDDELCTAAARRLRDLLDRITAHGKDDGEPFTDADDDALFAFLDGDAR
ncbi:Erythronolide synthase, modules 3 and 4 [Actinomadura rubteroloni]|uniref:Erythronolide synthase, modules 3 and 4 n=1 Tax=Actinomadura rubteroloni TaxID=1926885 RepID=A0A2P4UHJ2_9ACTN|nr:type I polyketide synthase [Actinomadura rubteroloni]POM24527.1 Erythronolide synthase, modules 3 and 4 [Actinomadura rubteroloni]